MASTSDKYLIPSLARLVRWLPACPDRGRSVRNTGLVGPPSYWLPRLLLSAAVVVLAAEPALWLFRTWQDPAYNSNGLLVFALALGLACWSLTSPLIRPAARSPLLPAVLLGGPLDKRRQGVIAHRAALQMRFVPKELKCDMRSSVTARARANKLKVRRSRRIPMLATVWCRWR